MKVALVYNDKSGGYSSVGELRKTFIDSSIEVIDSIKINAELESSLRKHIKNSEIIAVVGGDGTISAVANLLKGTDAALMPLPGGTLNHFTKDLGIPQSIPDSLEYFKSAKKTKVDTGQLGDKTFINNSSIGLYSDSLLVRDEHGKIYGKWPSMIISIVMTFIRFQTYNVSLNGRDYSTPLVFVGNNRYMLKGFSFQRTKLHEGLLSVYIFIGRSRLNLIWAMISLILGRKTVSKKLKSFHTKDVTISTKRSIRVSRDGEHEKMTSPLRYSMNAASLYVLQGSTKS